MPLPFRDRTDAGRALAQKLRKYKERTNTLVLALPRGGVPVGYEVAHFINAPLDIYLVRKLGVPGHEELALGAIATGGVRVLNYDVVHMTGLTEQAIDALAEREQKEIQRREALYRDRREPPEFDDRTVILVDDGLATGATMLAAARAIRKQRPHWLVVAVPVSSPDICDYFRDEVDEIVCAETPEPFRAVGVWYDNFEQTTDQEVRELLARAAREHVR